MEKIREFPGWGGDYVEYKETHNGETHTYTCSKEEWEGKIIIRDLVAAGVSENVLDKLYSIAWKIGYEDGEQNSSFSPD